MEENEIIAADKCCSVYNIELSFIQSLDEQGLIRTNKVNDALFIHFNELPSLEKYVHLHYDLNINLAGLEAITHLLDRIQNMQHDLRSLRNKLDGMR